MTNSNRSVSPRRFALAVAVIVVLTIGSGVSHGWLDGRWSGGRNDKEIGDKLRELPEQIGDWVSLGELDMPKSTTEMLRCYGYCFRAYRNSKTGDQVTFAVLVGPRGPIAVHSPDICYPSQGMKAREKRKPLSIETTGEVNRFWHVIFEPKNEIGQSIDVFYAWSDGKSWQASEDPRFWPAFHLYKLQLAGTPPEAGKASGGEEFLKAALPELKKVLATK